MKTRAIINTAIIILILAAAAWCHGQTAKVIDKEVPAVEHIYSCPTGYELAQSVPGTMDSGFSGPAIMETYTHYEPLRVKEYRDIYRSGPPTCIKQEPAKQTVKPALPAAVK